MRCGFELRVAEAANIVAHHSVAGDSNRSGEETLHQESVGRFDVGFEQGNAKTLGVTAKAAKALPALKIQGIHRFSVRAAKLNLTPNGRIFEFLRAGNKTDRPFVDDDLKCAVGRGAPKMQFHTV